MTKLTSHFTLDEAEFSDYATRHGLDNSVPPELIPKIILVAEKILEPLREKFGRPFSPTSWYRGPALNSAIGGAKSSQHTKGEAVDIKIPGVSNLEIAKWIETKLIDFDQLILECWDGSNPSTGWVHCSYVSPEKNRKQVLQYSRGKYTVGLPK